MSSFPQSYLTARKRGANVGATLMELLVGMFLMVLIGVVLISMLNQSSALVSQGTAMIATHQKSRSVIDRIAPYVATAVPGPTAAILTPDRRKSEETDPDITYDRIVFTTTEDFLRTAPPYNPSSGGVDEFWNPTTNGYHIYQIVFVEETADIGRVELQKMTGPGARDTTVTPRVLGHRVTDFATTLLSANALEVQVWTSAQRKGPQGNLIDVVEVESAVIPIPQGSYL